MARNPLVRNPKWFIRATSAVHKGMFKLTRGRLGNRWRGAPVVLLTTTGRKTGKDRTWPLLAVKEGDAYVLAGSFAGHDRHPSWFLNIEANPEVTVTDRGRKVRGRARIATDPERSTLYQRFIDVMATYGAYAKATDREIPVVIIEPL
jgi:F420H(2)-dependent quinone reductase